MSRIERTDRSVTDIIYHALFIARRQPDAARRFVTAAEDAIGKLAAMPGMGALRETADPDLAGLRRWPIKGFRNFLVIYRRRVHWTLVQSRCDPLACKMGRPSFRRMGTGASGMRSQAVVARAMRRGGRPRGAAPPFGRLAVVVVVVGVAVGVVGVSASAAGEEWSSSSGDPYIDALAPRGSDPGAPDFGAGIGYAHIAIGDSDSPLDSEDALRFEFWGSFSPFRDLPQLRLGAALGTGFVFDSGQHAVSTGGGLVVASNSDVPLITFEPELRLSWRQTFGRDGSGFFIEPGIAGGAFVAYLDFEADEDDVFDDDDDDFDEWDGTWAARAFINIGIRQGPGSAGIQASYLRGGDLDLGGGAEGDVEEFYLGIFGTLRF